MAIVLSPDDNTKIDMAGTPVWGGLFPIFTNSSGYNLYNVLTGETTVLGHLWETMQPADKFLAVSDNGMVFYRTLATLYRLDPETMTTTVVADLAGKNLNEVTSVSPDGEAILIGFRQEIIDIKTGLSVVIDAEGEGIVRNPWTRQMGEFAGDGRYLVFLEGVENPWDATIARPAVYDRETGVKTALTQEFNSGQDIDYAGAANAPKIAYITSARQDDGKNAYNLFVADLETGETTAISALDRYIRSDTIISLSDDGTKLMMLTSGSPDGQGPILATGYDNRKVWTIYDIPTGTFDRLGYAGDFLTYYNFTLTPDNQSLIQTTKLAGGGWRVTISDFDDAIAPTTATGSSGDDVLQGGYGEHTLQGLGGNDRFIPGIGTDHIQGGAGTDTVDYSGAARAVIIDLALGVGNGDGTTASSDTYDSIENVIGSTYDDLIYAGAAANQLDGRNGADEVSYARSDAGVTIGLGGEVGRGGYAEGDRLISISILTGSDFNDRLTGTIGADDIRGSAGDDVLDGGNDGKDELHGGTGDDRLVGGKGLEGFYGDDGHDIVDYSRSEQAVRVNIGQISGGGVGGHATGDRYYHVEGIIGSAFDDVLTGTVFSQARPGINSLYGGDGDDTLSGLTGSDLLDGGAGSDTACYGDSKTGVQIDLVAGIGHSGSAEGDTLVSIENVLGSAHDDVVIASGAANNIAGRGGMDTVSYTASGAAVQVNLATGSANGGYARGDVLTLVENLTGSAFGDNLSGDTGSNVLMGGDGNDILRGSGGADILNGGNGNDTAAYGESDAAVTVDLAAGTGAGGTAQGDVLVSIENAGGTGFNDRLSGTAGDNRLVGYEGADDLQGRDGNDTLIGGAGADTLDGGKGGDFASYEDMDIGVIVDLSNGTTSGGAAGDTLIGIEGLIGGSTTDRLSGTTGRNILLGGDGDDFLRGNAGADQLDGGDGSDTALYAESDAGIAIDLAAGTAEGGSAAGDTLASIENIGGTAFDDIIVGDGSDNRFTGYEGRDVFNGGDGNDILQGGLGGDRLTGGAGADSFVYISIDDSPTGAGRQDVIFDFTRGEDLIDLSAIDADPARPGNQAFRFLGQAGYDGNLGALILSTTTDGARVVSIDIDGDSVTDMRFAIYGAGSQLAASDFIL